jgi:hypothetical protein
VIADRVVSKTANVVSKSVRRWNYRGGTETEDCCKERHEKERHSKERWEYECREDRHVEKRPVLAS